MAVTNQNGVEYGLRFGTTPGAVYPTEVRGKVHMDFVTAVQVGAGDATSSVALTKLPPGRVRLILPLSYLYVNWTTASATLDLGWDAYTQLDGTAVVADPDGITNALDVDAADVYGFEELSASIGAGVTAATGYTKLFDSREGVVIRATSQDVAIIAADSLAGVLAYVCA